MLPNEYEIAVQKDRIFICLLRAQMTKTDLNYVTGYSFQTITRAVNSLIKEGSIEEVGYRYKVKENAHAAHVRANASGIQHGGSPRRLVG